MKTLKTILFFTVTAGLLLSCSKTDLDEDYLNADRSGTDLKSVNCPSKVVFVSPSGGDDTEILKAAFAEAEGYGRGSVVQLAKGEYKLSHLDVYDFYGSLKGKGKTETIITVLPGIISFDECVAKKTVPCIMRFVGGDVRLSDFTIRTPPGPVSVGGYIYSIINFSSFTQDFEFGNENRSINAVVDNVSVKGQFDEGGGYGGYNSAMGVRAGFDFFPVWEEPETKQPREKMNISITGSDFENFSYALVVEGCKNSKVVIGKINKGNHFFNCHQAGGIWEERDNEIVVEGNFFDINDCGLDLDNTPWYSCFNNEPSIKGTVSKLRFNTFKLKGGWYGFWLADPSRATDPGAPASIMVYDNLFNMEDGGWTCITGYLLNGTVIKNNRFTGSGYQGIYLDDRADYWWFDTEGIFNENGLILGNNFSSANFDDCAIYLNEGTKNWTIVAAETVSITDMGTGNKIIGVSGRHPRPGHGTEKNHLNSNPPWHGNFDKHPQMNHGKDR
jgi:hypothetical protein